MGWRESATNNHPGFIGFVIHTVVRFFQFVLAVTVCGLYAVDLNNARRAGFGPDGKWVYAEVVGALAAVSALVLMVPFIKSYLVFGWDLVLFILWTALFGLFGRMFIHEDPEGNGAIMRMKNAVWVDLANMLLWFITFLYGLGMFFFNRRRRSLHTGRATI